MAPFAITAMSCGTIQLPPGRRDGSECEILEVSRRLANYFQCKVLSGMQAMAIIERQAGEAVFQAGPICEALPIIAETLSYSLQLLSM